MCRTKQAQTLAPEMMLHQWATWSLSFECILKCQLWVLEWQQFQFRNACHAKMVTSLAIPVSASFFCAWLMWVWPKRQRQQMMHRSHNGPINVDKNGHTATLSLISCSLWAADLQDSQSPCEVLTSVLICHMTCSADDQFCWETHISSLHLRFLTKAPEAKSLMCQLMFCLDANVVVTTL